MYTLLYMSERQAVRDFLQSAGWVSGLRSVDFLAAGEYNENFLVQGAEGRFVFRVNHGSQLGIQEQIAYEFRVLQAVAPSGVTPRPLFVQPHPGTPGLAGGVLLMQFIEGRPFDYQEDRDRAAAVFARVHALGGGEGLIRQPDPVAAIAAESLGMLHRFPDHPLQRERRRLLAYHDEVARLGERCRAWFRDEPQCIVNTEVNSGNFLVRGEQAFLVDWEKAVLSSRYQDLGHFLVPTTTLWKTEHRYGEQDKQAFLAAYRRQAGLETDPQELLEKTRVLERTILLRALSWCHMAFYEYTCGGRALRDPRTFGRLRRYLCEIDAFLK